MNSKKSLFPETLQTDDSMATFMRLLVRSGQINMNFPPVTIGEIVRRNYGDVSRRYVKSYIKKALRQGLVTATHQHRGGNDCMGYYVTDKGHEYAISAHSTDSHEILKAYNDGYNNETYSQVYNAASPYFPTALISLEDFMRLVTDVAIAKASLTIGFSPIPYRDAFDSLYPHVVLRASKSLNRAIDAHLANWSVQRG